VAVTITRILVEGIASTPNQTVTLTDQATGTVLGTGPCDGAGAFSVPVPFGIFLAGAAAGQAWTQGVLLPGAQSGAAAGAGGGSGVLTQTQPLAGAAGGAGGGGAVPVSDPALSGTAAGTAGGSGVVAGSASVVGAAGGAGGASGTLGTAAGGGAAAYVSAGAGVSGVVSLAVPFPASGIQSGDLLWLVRSYSDGIAPSGWTQRDDAGAGAPGMLYKYATGSENGTSVTIGAYDDGSGEDPQNLSGRIFVFRSTAAANPVHADGDFDNFASQATVTGDALTSIPAGSMLAFFVLTGSAETPSGVGGGIDTLATGTGGFHLGYKASVGANPAAPTMTFGSAQNGVSYTVAIKGS
jgi:hypothetical protein